IWINGSNAGPLRCEGYLAQEFDPGTVHIEAGQPPIGAQIATSETAWTLIVGPLYLLALPFVIADAHNWGGYDVSFTAETGQNYFIKYTLKKGWLEPLPQLTLMPPEVGAAEIRDCPSGSKQSCRYSQ